MGVGITRGMDLVSLAFNLVWKSACLRILELPNRVIILWVCAILGEEKRDGLSHGSPRYKALACLLPSPVVR